MTNEIAYELGQAKYPCFYSHALWKVNKEPFPLVEFFRWSVGIMGYPCNDKGIDWEGFRLHGSLKLDKFTTLSDKLAYLRGSMTRYCFKRKSDTEISWHFANSYDICDFVCNSVHEVIKHGFCPRVWASGDKIWDYKVVQGETLGTIPGTPSVTVTADKEIIDWLVGGENPLDIQFKAGSCELTDLKDGKWVAKTK